VAEEQPDNVPSRSPLSLGSLEYRLPPQFLWNGPTGVALCNEATNWSGGSIPQPGDAAVFQRPAEKAPEGGGDAVQETDGSS
jgi:hypothetical protein